MPSSAGYSVALSPTRRSFPTRRASDLCSPTGTAKRSVPSTSGVNGADTRASPSAVRSSSARTVPSAAHGVTKRPKCRTSTSCFGPRKDRKSTRLNSSHLGISYAVFCWLLGGPLPDASVFPDTTRFRSLLSDWNGEAVRAFDVGREWRGHEGIPERSAFLVGEDGTVRGAWRYETAEVPDFDELLRAAQRSEEHTSELQSLRHLVCRLLLATRWPSPRRVGLSRHDALPISALRLERRSGPCLRRRA